MDLLTLLKENRFGRYYISYDGSSNYDCGYDYGDGCSDGDGYGDGWGESDGQGDSYGDGWGSGNGNGNGNGDDIGWGIGDRNGLGTGSYTNSGWEITGFNGWEIAEINGMKVYAIDGMPTAIETVFGAYAKGYTFGNGITLNPCYVAMDGFSFAHGKTLKEAFRDAMAKDMKRLPKHKRVKRFISEHPDPEEILSNKELFCMHNALTGSCEFGRRAFCRKNNIDLESSMSILKFLTLTENEYGGSVIKKIREKYLH